MTPRSHDEDHELLKENNTISEFCRVAFEVNVENLGNNRNELNIIYRDAYNYSISYISYDYMFIINIITWGKNR